MRLVHTKVLLSERRDPIQVAQALNPSMELAPFRFSEGKRSFEAVELRQRLEGTTLAPGHETQSREETGETQHEHA
jgi:hypothetical protein